MSEDLGDIIGELERRAASHEAEANDHLLSAQTLREAVDQLRALAEKRGASLAAPPPRLEVPRPRSVSPFTSKSKTLRELIEEIIGSDDRVWSGQAVLKEAAERGTPVRTDRPLNSVLTMMSRMSRDGALVRVDKGRYRAAKSPLPGLDGSNRASVYAVGRGGA